MAQSFYKKISAHWQEQKFVCIGLDPDYEKIPQSLKAKYTSLAKAFFAFNKAIIDTTADLVCAYKPQAAFYEAEGIEGVTALFKTVSYIRQSYPSIPIIYDAKRADIGHTNDAYAKAAFDTLGADAMTVNLYPGQEALKPFLDRKDKGIIIWLKTSNPKGSTVQGMVLKKEDQPFYKVLARDITSQWNTNGNVGVVVGATYPKELKEIREIIGDMLILIPGLGAQGGDLQKAIQFGKNSKNEGMILNFSRSIIYASQGKDFAQKAREEVLKIHAIISKTI